MLENAVADLSLVKTGLEFPLRPPSGHPQSGLLSTLSDLQDNKPDVKYCKKLLKLLKG